MTLLRMAPIDIDANGNPLDERLFGAMQAYSKAQFGDVLNPLFYKRLWAVEAWDPERPEYHEVMGVAGIRMVPDCCTFHVTPPTPNKEGIKMQHFARDMMIHRLLCYCSDLGQRGAYGLIYVAPEQQARWASFLEHSQMKPANRYTVVFP